MTMQILPVYRLNVCSILKINIWHNVCFILYHAGLCGLCFSAVIKMQTKKHGKPIIKTKYRPTKFGMV